VTYRWPRENQSLPEERENDLHTCGLVKQAHSGREC